MIVNQRQRQSWREPLLHEFCRYGLLPEDQITTAGSAIADESATNYAAGLAYMAGTYLLPSGSPLGQNRETNVSFASQLTEPSACTARRGDPAGPEYGLALTFLPRLDDVPRVETVEAHTGQ